MPHYNRATFGIDRHKITHARIGDLVPNASNARTHSPRQLAQIARSIERFGFNNPVLIDDNNKILAGHGRVGAAKLLGLDTIPVLKIDHLIDIEKRAYVLADNKLAEKAGWDAEILALELQDLVDLDFDVELTGFETGEIDVLLDGKDTDGNDADDACPDDSMVSNNAAVETQSQGRRRDHHRHATASCRRPGRNTSRGKRLAASRHPSNC
jgi:ParB-like chromosome segregation protein Spo0J